MSQNHLGTQQKSKRPPAVPGKRFFLPPQGPRQFGFDAPSPGERLGSVAGIVTFIASYEQGLLDYGIKWIVIGWLCAGLFAWVAAIGSAGVTDFLHDCLMQLRASGCGRR